MHFEDIRRSSSLAFVILERLLAKRDHLHSYPRVTEMASGTTMQAGFPAPERVTLAGTLEIPRMINGLWQLAGGHDQDAEIQSAVVAMEPL